MTTYLGTGPRAIIPVTTTWSLPFAIYEFVLVRRVIQQRIEHSVFVGDSCSSTSTTTGPDPLKVAVRSHANFLEYVPWTLGLASLVEINGGDKRILHGILATLLVARVAHVELGVRDPEKGAGPGRIPGFMATQAALLAFAGYGAYLVKGYWGF